MPRVKIITINEGEAPQEVSVFEIRVSQMEDALLVLGVLTDDRSQDLQSLATTILSSENGAAKRLLHGMTSLGDAIDSLGGMALMDVLEAWFEVNSPFFDRIGKESQKIVAKVESRPSPQPIKQQPKTG